MSHEPRVPSQESKIKKSVPQSLGSPTPMPTLSNMVVYLA